MSRENVKICPCCGRKIVEYKHKLNAVLVSGLVMLHRAGGMATLSELDLDVSRNNNFQKLKYFGLAEKVEGSRLYTITDYGRRFLAGQASVPSEVYTIDGRVVRIGFENVFVSDIDIPVQYREEWEEQASFW